MFKMITALVALSMASQGLANPFECPRGLKPVRPAMVEAKVDDDKRAGQTRRFYKTQGETVFGMRVFALEYLRVVNYMDDGSKGFTEFNYLSQVDGDLDDVIAKVEGTGAKCSPVEDTSLTNACMTNDGRMISVYPALNAELPDSRGIVIHCAISDE